MISVNLLRAELGESKSIEDAVYRTAAHIARNGDTHFNAVDAEWRMRSAS